MVSINCPSYIITRKTGLWACLYELIQTAWIKVGWSTYCCWSHLLAEMLVCISRESELSSSLQSSLLLPDCAYVDMSSFNLLLLDFPTWWTVPLNCKAKREIKTSRLLWSTLPKQEDKISFFCLFGFALVFQDRVSLCSSSSGLQFRDPPASDSQRFPLFLLSYFSVQMSNRLALFLVYTRIFELLKS